MKIQKTKIYAVVLLITMVAGIISNVNASKITKASVLLNGWYHNVVGTVPLPPNNGHGAETVPGTVCVASPTVSVDPLPECPVGVEDQVCAYYLEWPEYQQCPTLPPPAQKYVVTSIYFGEYMP